jgi:hypothetical protein
MDKIGKIIIDEITNYINSKCMIKEYKNPNDSETVRVCGDMLQQLYDSIINNGCSKHEITVETMGKIIGELRRLEEMMK